VESDATSYPTEREDQSGAVGARAVSCPDEEARWIISKAAKLRLEDALGAVRSGAFERAEALLAATIDSIE
jgi:hypothetical protein